MQSVFNLLSLPSSHGGFSALKPSSAIVDGHAPGSAHPPPPHKRARLDNTDSDASADRSSSSLLAAKSASANANADGPRIIRLVGFPAKPAVRIDDARELQTVKQCLSYLLSRFPTGSQRPRSYEDVYSAVRHLVCDAKRGEELYGALQLALERCVTELGGTEELMNPEDFPTTSGGQSQNQTVRWLEGFVDRCAWFEKQLGIVQSLLTFLDRVYVLDNPSLQSSKDLGFRLFQGRIFGLMAIYERLQGSVEAWLTSERQARQAHANRQLIPRLIGHLRTHNQYAAFEEYYVQLTQAFYATEAEALHKSDGIDSVAFLAHAQERIEEEQQRSQAVLPEESWEIVREMVEHTWLDARLPWLASEAFGRFIKERKLTEISRMHELFRRVDATKVLCDAFKLHVQSEVQAIVTDTERDGEMVERLLSLKSFCRNLIDNVFLTASLAPPPSPATSPVSPLAPRAVPSSSRTQSGPGAKKANTEPTSDFAHALEDAFQGGFRTRRKKPAELLAKHMDRALRRGQRELSDAVFMSELKRALELCRATDDKDVFRAFYQRALAKRLLTGRSASNDVEASVLEILEKHYDSEFGMCTQMFKDLQTSQTMFREYSTARTKAKAKKVGPAGGSDMVVDEDKQKKRNIQEGDSPSGALHVIVVQKSTWPIPTRQHDAHLPPALQDEVTSYTAFYKEKHNGRKLDWDHSLGTATLRARFSAGEKELSVSLYQAVVLLLFNSDEAEILYSAIKEATQMEDKELRRTLQSLACGKKRVLRKSTKGPEVHDSDTFKTNLAFTDPKNKVHINSIVAAEAEEETARTQSAIEGERKYTLDAAIVRIMKAKKKMRHARLIEETIEAVAKHFVPDVRKDIKPRIDHLVEEEYMRRDDDDNNLYHYVA